MQLERNTSSFAVREGLHAAPAAQEQLPRPSAQAVAQAAALLRVRAGRAHAPPARVWRPTRRLCALLNDLREARASHRA